MNKAAHSDEIRLLSVQINNGAITPLIDEYLDDLLRWLAGSDAENKLDPEFTQLGIDQNQLRSQFTQLLDQYLFAPTNSSYSILGLTPGTRQAVVRDRYYRLLKVFHPDHQQDNLAWWTDRAERLNHAYAALKSERVAAESVADVGNGAPRQTYAHYPQNEYGSGTMGRVRQSLGRGQQFRFRFFAAAILVSAGLLFYIYSRNVTIDTLEAYRSAPHEASRAIPQQSIISEVISAPPPRQGPSDALVAHTTKPALDTSTAQREEEPQNVARAVTDVLPEINDFTEPLDSGAASAAALEEKPAAGALAEVTQSTSQSEEITPESVMHEQVLYPAQFDLKITGLDDITRELASVSSEKVSIPPVAAQEIPAANPARQAVQQHIESPVTNGTGKSGADTAAIDHTATAAKTGPANGSGAAGIVNPTLGKNETQTQNTNTVDPNTAIDTLFGQFSYSYRQGDAQDLSDLFVEDGIDGGDIGKARIKETYEKIFDRTNSRELSFFIDKIKARENNSFLVEARYRASLDYPSRRRQILEDGLTAWIQESGGAYKIQRLVYSK